MSRFRQAIHIEGTHGVEHILALPCVMGCRKLSGAGQPLQVGYLLSGDIQATHIRWGELCTAAEGDWLCEDTDGRWHVMHDHEYQKRVKNQ